MATGEAVTREQQGSRETGAGPAPERAAPRSQLPAPDTLGPLREPDFGRVATDRLTAMFDRTAAVREVTLAFPPHSVTAIIGPSGCGKSTFLRGLNRMHEL